MREIQSSGDVLMDKLPIPQLTDGSIVADADYFETKARQCYRLASRVAGDAAKVTLITLASAFEEKAWELRDHERRYREPH